MTEEKKFLARIMTKMKQEIDKKPCACLHPGCTQLAIKSHSQQKNGPLKVISVDGKVYSLKVDYGQMFEEGRLVLSEVTTSKASTFLGYCSGHDTELFNPIEQQKLIVGNKEQADLFFIRAYSYEYTRKKTGMDLRRQVSTKIDRQTAYGFDTSFEKMNRCFNQHFIDIEKPFYIDQFFQKPTFRQELCHAWREIPQNLGVSLSCCFPPICNDDVEAYAFENADSPLPMVAFTLVPENNKTHVILSWHKSFSKYVRQWVDRLRSKDIEEVELLINECVFSKSEDFCISPAIWEQISDVDKSNIFELMRHEYYRGTDVMIPLLMRINAL